MLFSSEHTHFLFTKIIVYCRKSYSRRNKKIQTTIYVTITADLVFKHCSDRKEA